MWLLHIMIVYIVVPVEPLGHMCLSSEGSYTLLTLFPFFVFLGDLFFLNHLWGVRLKLAVEGGGGLGGDWGFLT